MQQDKLKLLVDKYMSNQLTESELDAFFHYLEKGKLDVFLTESLLNDLKSKSVTDVYLPVDISDNIIRNISASINFTKQAVTIKEKSKVRTFSIYAVAASVIIILALSFFYTYQSRDRKQIFSQRFKSTNKKAAYNSTSFPMKLLLDDGSVVILQPGSALNYSTFEGNKREVYLEGDAFFDVAKNKLKPFYVYSGSVVAKVLGTSFFIKNHPKNGDTEVEVKSGKVQVSPNLEILKDESIASQTTIVAPNHKVVFKQAEKVFEPTLAANPVLLKQVNDYISTDSSKVEFIFHRESIRNIIKEFHKHYQIEILVENEELYNCVFTGDVSEQDLYSKLKIICLTINANYELNGTKILITGKGCYNSIK
jgi:hypothetical protein